MCNRPGAGNRGRWGLRQSVPCGACMPLMIALMQTTRPCREEAPPAPPGSSRGARNPTPHLDRLRKEGVVFTRAYAASSVSAASRLAVLTGRYPSRSKNAQAQTRECTPAYELTDVEVLKTKLDDSFDLKNNLQTALRVRGYRTGVVGKWHLSSVGSDKWAYAKYQDHVRTVKQTGMDFVDGLYIAEMDQDDLEFSHNMEWVSSKAHTFIERSVQEQTPFFLYYNPTLPRSPSGKEALEKSIRNTPIGQLQEDPVSGMPSRSSVKERASTCCDYVTDRKVGAIQVSSSDAIPLCDGGADLGNDRWMMQWARFTRSCSTWAFSTTQ